MPGFDLEEFPISPKEKERLDALHDTLVEKQEKLLGFPSNLLYDYRDLYRFFAFSLNNIGDPLTESLYEINTRAFEREIISFFAELYHAPKEAFWGYVTNGGTEGILYGLYLARESLSNGVVYFSEDTHYSVLKAVKILGVSSIITKSQPNGEIDYGDLEEKIKNDRERPPVIVANIGTTIKGAVDGVEKIADILRRNAIRKFYIHCDAALGGMILPFVDGAPIFDFRMPIGSISVSGHKMIGSPMPCGIVIARKENVERIQQEIEYLGTHDTTLSGSRNGHSVLFFWYSMRKFGIAGFQKMVEHCIETKEYALARLKEISWDAWAEKYSVTVIIKRPSELLAKKWQLAVQGDIAHIVLMPHVSRDQIDELVEDLKKEK